jgi:hypothetical protein
MHQNDPALIGRISRLPRENLPAWSGSLPFRSGYGTGQADTQICTLHSTNKELGMSLIKTMTTAVLIAAVASGAGGGGAALAADNPLAPIGGQMKFFVTTLSNGTGNIIVTGAIGDYGRSAADGNYLEVTLHDGGFELDVAKLVAKASEAGPTLDPTTCSGVSTATAPAPMLDGKGNYRGAAGTMNVTETIAFILPRYRIGPHEDQCNNNTRPIDDYSSITGSGMVKFS